ncbi:unnamed protein product [Amoebophrya sp. A120]|nr:unnamed protein product [Amoebophrya sp. A120]|eukprot:GSA120T00004727001.1
MSRHGSMQQVLEDLVNQVSTCVPTVKSSGSTSTSGAAKSSFLEQGDYVGVGKGPKPMGVKNRTGFVTAGPGQATIVPLVEPAPPAAVGGGDEEQVPAGEVPFVGDGKGADGSIGGAPKAALLWEERVK